MEDVWLVTCETCRRSFSISASSEPEAKRKFVRHHVHGATQVEEARPTEGEGSRTGPRGKAREG